MNASSVSSFILGQQHGFNTLSLLMLTRYLFPKSAELKGMLVFLARSRFDWNYTAVPDNNTGKCHQRSYVELPAGKVLGGSSAINFMITSRGNSRDYQRWAKWPAAAKDSSWEFKNLLPLFKRSERVFAPNIVKSPLGKYRGAGDCRQGNIAISVHNGTVLNQYLKTFEEMGNEVVEDFYGKQSTGLTRGLLSIEDGFRQSTAYGYLVPAYNSDSKTNPKLLVSKNTLVTKIIFDGNKNVIGVTAVMNNKKPILLKAKHEVIVTAGALKTPQLLMLSGIGEKEVLKQKNIKLISDLPVGKNLQDHAVVTIVHKNQKKPPPYSIDYHEFPAPLVIGFKSLNGSKENPDYGTITYITNYPGNLLGYCAYTFNFKQDICDRMHEHEMGREIVYTHLFGLNPKSRGKLSLKSKNPNDTPIVDMGYYTQKEDMENTIKYINDYASIVNTTFFKNSGGSIANPASGKYCPRPRTDRNTECYARCMSSTLWNYCGTCSMGALVDSKLKVIGVNKLRVADASVIPNLISGGIYQPTIVVAKKASDMIKEDGKIKINT